IGPEIFRRDHILVDQLEDHTVDQQRLENFSDIKRKRKTPFRWLVKERYRLVELGLVDGIERIFRRLSAPAAKREPVFEDLVKGTVIEGSDVSFRCEQLPDIFDRLCLLHERPDVRDLSFNR